MSLNERMTLLILMIVVAMPLQLEGHPAENVEKKQLNRLSTIAAIHTYYMNDKSICNGNPVILNSTATSAIQVIGANPKNTFVGLICDVTFQATNMKGGYFKANFSDKFYASRGAVLTVYDGVTIQRKQLAHYPSKTKAYSTFNTTQEAVSLRLRRQKPNDIDYNFTMILTLINKSSGSKSIDSLTLTPALPEKSDLKKNLLLEVILPSALGGVVLTIILTIVAFRCYKLRRDDEERQPLIANV